MKEKILKLSRFLLLCAVMVLITMIPQNIKAITVEEAGNVYMTDSQAGKETPLYGRLNINYTGNTNYDTWAYDIVTNYNTAVNIPKPVRPISAFLFHTAHIAKNASNIPIT